METPAGDDPRKQQIESFNKFGAYQIPAIVIIAWATAMSYFGYIGGGWGSIEWGAFALHPTFMVTGFLLFGSLAIVTYRLCKAFGMSHNTAKWIHVSLNTVATVLVWLGYDIICVLHNAAGSHFKGSHSRVGIVTLFLWSIHYLAGLYIFFFAPKEKEVTYLELHKAFGNICIILALWTIGLGLLWEEYGYDADRDVYARSRSGVVVGCTLLLIFLIFGMMMYARTLLPK